MPIEFQPISMMELRNAPGDILDRVAQQNEAFIVERNGHQMACLVPLSSFMPDIQPTRLAREFESLESKNEKHTAAITDSFELWLRFRQEGKDKNVEIAVLLPHGYPNASPKVYASPLPDKCPHRWQDGSLCLFGAVELWNPGKHDIVSVLTMARQWLSHFEGWQATGTWGGGRTSHV
jgi:ubiquitin-protein ligase